MYLAKINATRMLANVSVIVLLFLAACGPSGGGNQSQAEILKSIDQLQRELGYWSAQQKARNSQGLVRKWWQIQKIFKK